MIQNFSNTKKGANLDYLLSLSKGNLKFVREMIETFLTENPKEIGSLGRSIENKNFEAIKQAAHLLQSSIPFVGLDKIIENEVYEIEKIADERVGLEKVNIPSARKSVIQKMSTLRTDQATLEKIEQLFTKVKRACEDVCEELSQSGYLKRDL